MPRPSKSVVSVAQAAPEDLLAQAADGNPGALGQIFDRYAPQLLGLIRRILPDTESSELALEWVFERLWKEARRVAQARVSVSAWLTVAARSRAVDEARRLANGQVDEERGFEDTLSGTLEWIPGPEAISKIEERRALLKKVLAQLPRAQLDAFERLAFGGRSEYELACEAGEPLARVRSELRAAARFLRHRRRAVVGSWTVSI